MKRIYFVCYFIASFLYFPLLDGQDVAICGIDNLGSDEFAFVALRDFQPGEKIYFSEARYSDLDDAFLTDEGHIEFTADAFLGLPENTVVSITVFNSSSVGTDCQNRRLAGSAINVPGTGTFNLAVDDEIYGYTAQDPQSPWNTIIDVSCFLWTDNSQIPTNQLLDNDYPNAIVVSNTGGILDGFAGNFKVPSRINTTYSMLNDINQWDITTGGIDMDLTPFTNQQLPVELVSFSGKESERYNMLQWTTITETGNAHFIVEHSENGTDFKPLGKVSGNGNSQEEKNYEFLHRKPVKNDNYYRLKQVDFNGLFEYSPIIQINNRNSDSPFSVYPNPVKDVFSIKAPSELSLDHVTLEIYNLHGQMLLSNHVDLGSDPEIELSSLNPGTYFIRLLSKGKIYYSSFIKQ